MRHIAPALAGLALIAGTPAIAQRVTTAPLNTQRPDDCPLVVDFASYGTGINRPVLQVVEKILTRDRAVTSITRYPWGREGEITLCVRTRTSRAATRLFHQLKPRLPRRHTPPISMVTRNGLRFRASN